MLTLGLPMVPDPEVFAALCAEIWESRRLTNDGPLARRLEDQLSALLEVSSVRVTCSGTLALTLALLALDLPPGSEVVTTPLTFAATPLAIEAAGHVPVMAAVDPETLTMTAEGVEAALTPRTGAVLPVHLFGVACSTEVDDVARAHDLPVVFDGAHAFGSVPDAGRLAPRGAATCYSLHATKLLHTGEGGAVATADAGLAERVASLRAFGLHEGQVTARGTNAKLPEVSAALGLALWERLPAETARRAQIRATYRTLAERSPRARPHLPDRDRALLFEVVRCDPDDQDALVADLADAGVAARRFPTLVSPGSRYAAARVAGSSPAAVAALSRTALALPLHGGVTDDHLEAIAGALRA